MCLLHRCSLVSRFTLFHKFTVFEAVSSNENIENGFCFSVFGSSNSATCHMEQLVSIRWHNINLCIFGVVTCPLSMTRIRSACITVLMRCAMVSMVQSLKASLMVFWMRASVSESMDAVASSKRIICQKITSVMVVRKKKAVDGKSVIKYKNVYSAYVIIHFECTQW